MVRFTVAAVSLCVLCGAAQAADMRARFGPPPMMAAAPSWTGFYLGLNAGGGIGVSRSAFSIAGTTFATVDNALSGAIGGGQVGYNWQSGAMVFGVEADFQASGVKGTLATPCAGALCAIPLTASYSEKVPWFGTVRGRIGFAAAGWLLYATGGYAYARLDTAASATAGALTATLNTSENRNGWTVGGGSEMMLAPNWSAKVEYLYLDLGSQTTSYVFPAVATVNDSVRTHLHVGRAGVNYKF